MIDTLRNDRVTFVSTLVITLLAIVVERLWTRVRAREAAAAGAPARTAAMH